MRKSLVVLLPVIGFFAIADLSRSAAVESSSSAAPGDESCGANDTNDIEYLVFWDGYGSVDDLVARLGTTGDSTNRQLGFGAMIPVWVPDESYIVQLIKQGFDTAKRANVAVHFNVDDLIGWDKRPDLWNWYDPAKRGYSLDNRKNVEWYDWGGTANKRRYLTPAGIPSQAPQMCYNSPAIQKEIARIIFQVVGPALRKEIEELKLENREYLFAGLTVGSEAGYDDYSKIPELNLDQIPRRGDPLQMQVARLLRQIIPMMNEDKAPHSRLGYCSLTNAGYSKLNPPADFNQALAGINQQLIQFWDKQLFDAGIPCSRIYTHVAAPALQDDDNNAPIRIVFNPYARPGWTTYAIGALKTGFQPLYTELAKHGNPVWGGVEANDNFPDANPAARPSWEEYLAWHYNHGAKLVGINVGASGPSLMALLRNGAFGAEAIAAYKKFLNGEKLIEK